jgi:carbamoyl-phosphate synthase large subunit
VKSQPVRKVSDPGTGTQDVAELIADRKVECVINIPKRTADETVLTDGYRIRRAAADFGIPLVNDTELARLFIRALLRHPRQDLDAKPLYAYVARSRPSGSSSPRT